MQGLRTLGAPKTSILSTRTCRRSASLFRPLDWMREKLSPATKEIEDEEKLKAAKAHAKKEGLANVFEDVLTSANESVEAIKKGHFHKYSTANFKISHRKLNMLANQIAGKPIDHAILQMQFSEKRASTRIMNMLATARDHSSRYKHLEQEKLVVSEAWVSKGRRPPTRVEPRGRGHFGTRSHPNSKLSVILKEGKTVEEEKAAARKRKLNKIVSASLVREDKPIRNPSLSWAW